MTLDLPGLAQQIAHFEDRLMADPGSRVFLPLADLYRRVGRLEKAHEILKRGLAGDPSCVSARVLLGIVLKDLGRGRDCRVELQDVLSHDPDNLVALRILGDEAEAMGDWKLAGGFRERLLRLVPEDPDVRHALRESRKRLAREVEAKQADADECSEPEERHFTSGAMESPVEAVRQSVASVPRPASTVETPTLADLYRQQGYPEKARQIIDRILADDPERPDALAVLARIEQDAMRDAESGASQSRISETAQPAQHETDPIHLSSASRHEEALRRFRHWLDSGKEQE